MHEVRTENSPSPSPIINWIEQKIEQIAQTVEKDAKEAAKSSLLEVADYLNKHEQIIADKVKAAIEQAGGPIEAEIAKIGAMIGTDIDQAIQVSVADVCKFLGIDPTTAQKIESEIQSEVDSKVSKVVTNIENGLKNFVDHAATKIDSVIFSHLQHLEKDLRDLAEKIKD
jgi:phage-related tail protein